MRASLRATYGLDLREVIESRTMPAGDLADLVTYLPEGSPFWKSFGGPKSLTDEAHLLRSIDYQLRVLAWQRTEDAAHKRNQPKPPAPIPYAGEKLVEEAHAMKQAAARRRRLGR